MIFGTPLPSFDPPPISEFLQRYQQYERSFHTPLPLAIKKATSIVTCMVSLLPLT
jgi:hypothetical protein